MGRPGFWTRSQPAPGQLVSRHEVHLSTGPPEAGNITCNELI